MKLAGGSGDGLIGGAGGVFVAGRPREGKGFKGGGRSVAGAILKRCPHAQRPQFVQTGMEDAEEIVIVTGDGNCSRIR